METDSENLEVPYWRTLFEAAVLELDGKKQLEFIADAEHAIMDRMVHLNRSNDGSEIQMLENALTVLGQLRKISPTGRPKEPMVRNDGSGDRCSWRAHWRDASLLGA